MKLSERDVKVVNTSDADIGSLIATSKLGDAFVTWNPILMTGRNVRGVTMIYDSSKIPGQIIDTLMVRTSVSDNCKKAVTGAWYEAMALMSSSGPGNVAMVRDLAAQAGGTEAEFKAQLTTTRMFFNPAEAAAFASGPQVKQTMEAVARFSFAHGLYERAPNAEYVGIQYPDGVVFGNRVNTKLRFDARYMQMAALGQL